MMPHKKDTGSGSASQLDSGSGIKLGCLGKFTFYKGIHYVQLPHLLERLTDLPKILNSKVFNYCPIVMKTK